MGNTDRTDREHVEVQKKARKTGTPAHSTRGRYLWVAGDKAVSAGDESSEYRPRKLPANSQIMKGCGRCGRCFAGFSGKTNAVVFSAGQPHRLAVLVAASNVLCSRGLYPRWNGA
jgi:hypothetical protein